MRMILAAALLLGLIDPAGAEPIRLACAANGIRTEPLPGFLVVEIQNALAALGYRPGPADGVLGPRTRASIRAFEAKIAGRSGLSTKEYQLRMLLTLLPDDDG